MATVIPPEETSSRILRLFRRSRETERKLVGPIRGEVFGADRLAKHARNIARKHKLLPPRKQRGPGPLLDRLDDTRKVLAEIYARLAEAAERKSDLISPAGEWLLDNHYIVQEHIREIRTNLPGGYYQELPKLANGTLAHYPRVYEVAIELIAHTEGHITLENITLFVREYQKIAQLKMGELWAIPTMLRLGLVENIRRMSLRVAARLDEVEKADEWAAKIMTANVQSPDALTSALDEFIRLHPPFSPSFVARFLHQIRGYQVNFTPLVWLEQWIAEDGPSAEVAVTRSNRMIALTQITVSNCITSLRAIARFDWKDFVESQSSTEKILRKDLSGYYTRMMFGTRDHYRHVVEHIAKQTKKAEDEVANIALGLTVQGHGQGDEPRSHVGYYLVGEGRAELEEATGYRPPVRETLYRWTQRHPTALFFGGIAVTTALLLAILVLVVPAASAAQWTAVFLLALLPLNEIGISVVNQLATLLLPPHVLPKMDFRETGIPDEHRTAVVVPTLFSSVGGVNEALMHIEVQYLANRDPNLFFAILSDYTDAGAETKPEDEAILRAAVDGMEELNRRHRRKNGDVFFLFHRKRIWNERQGVWMGWERKRGKLGQFNRYLRGAAEDAFSTIVGDTSPLLSVRHVITLDSDTVLPRDAAQMLTGTMAHPLNKAYYDDSLGRIVRGYGILQPRVGVSLTSAHASHFASIHSGHPGVDPYTTAVSDVYQDLFSEGSFTGKGIYDVDAFELATHGRFPENTLLSHDLIEGAYSRAGLATDIEVFDDYPARYLTYTRRKHRWIRGDWQLLQWLGRTVPGPQGPTRNRLSAISRWKIFDNLRRSVIEISQVVLLVAGWFFLPGTALMWTAIVLTAIAAPWIFSIFLALLRPPRDQSWPAYYAAVARDAGVSVQQWTLAVAFLPHQAVVSADAIIRTLIRLFLTKRNLLEWQTASQVERSMVARSSLEIWRRMWPVTALALTLVAAVVLHAEVGGMPASSRMLFLAGTLPLLAYWLASPALAHSLSSPALAPELRLTGAERQAALRYAQLHWQYFEQFVSEETQWLAPDNFQEDPEPVVAPRTSPTNIGLQLMSIISARDLGFITFESTIERLERVFRTLERMRRFHGHFYNWYDLRDLRVLEPAYISTVDSGNFAGHLIAVKQGCLEMVRDPECTPETALRLRAIAERAREYALEMDFRFLFDEKRKLFSIGFQPVANVFDNSYYDLLASESRLASYIAIAKDDVPVDHWFRLGRALTAAGGTRTLVSWSGSMFEYLMPALVLRTFPSTLLSQTNQGAVRRHIAYGAERGIPWGISESAYNVRDRAHTYQYRAFGVPDLALKRGLSRELVIAPYATALALLVEPHQAIRNLAVLEADGALGPYGFRDAIDYTRPQPGEKRAVVGAYMAHHIGMSLVAFDNALNRNIWQTRFHADAVIRSAELILQERIPRRLVLQDVHQQDDPMLVPAETEKPAVRELDTASTPQPRIALLGNVPYTMIVSNAGSGVSRFGEIAINRWRGDGTRDNYGQWCYIRDVTTGDVWSAGHHPVRAKARWYQVLFASDRATFHRRDGDIETLMEVAIVPGEPAGVRKITVFNRSTEPKEIELTSYMEVVLAKPDSDRAHPAFGNLFVQTEWLPGSSAVLAMRRPRSATDKPAWCGHVVATRLSTGPVSCETDRAKFVGRGRTSQNPVAMDAPGDLSGTTGAVLDPIFSLRTRFLIAPGRSAEATFTTFVAEDREHAMQLADLYHDPYSSRRALDLSWAHAQAELRELGISPADAALYQELAGHLLFANPGFRSLQAKSAGNKLGQQELWGLGISGDYPILLATLESADGLPSVRQLLKVHHYWRTKGVGCDLVILNEHPPTYLQELNDELLSTVMASSEAGMLDRPGGIFIRRADILTPDDIRLLTSLARIQVDCDGLGLGNFLEFPHEDPATPPLREIESPAPVALPATADEPAIEASPGTVRKELAFFNGIGGFNDESEYEIRIEGDELPPAPWINVVGNPTSGFTVSETGAGATWAANSYFFRLSPWNNDPVKDEPGECIYLRDDESGEVWNVTAGPIRHTTPYITKHGAGYSIFEHEHAGLHTSLRVGMPETDPVKLQVMKITNPGPAARRLTVTGYVEWVLGVNREQTAVHVRTEMAADNRVMIARNYFDPTFAHLAAFSGTSAEVSAWTGARQEFIGRNRDLSGPLGLKRASLSGEVGDTVDPCAALQSEIEIGPGETREIVFLLGAGEGNDGALELFEKYRDPDAANAAIDQAAKSWRSRLSAITVRTPEPAFDLVLNQWALYQALSCRMWARSALYQSSGAFGFRDQLQDVMAFTYTEPQLAKEHIVRCAARQFEEGDVQHWWHPQSGRGVRTRFSDDLVWLPYVVNNYITVTGDASVLDESAPFLRMRPLDADEHEVYDLPEVSKLSASVYEHCLLALRKASTTGVHGLPLIGIGDWNDGMNRVGVDGKGESVWLAWFLIDTLRGFAVHAEQRKDSKTAAGLRDQADRYRTAVEASAWDGAWYRRAYYDDGAPLGSSESDECKIDSIAQSWSVISGAGEPARSAQAIESLIEHLVREDARLIMLLTPPFEKGTHDPGYIQGYLPGVRENGAQYTHAALWAALACARLGQGDRAMHLYQMINPVTHGITPEDVATYKVEPYVVAADVYTAEGHLGRGGWTWYTGSASWLYRVGLEAILGFTLRADTLEMKPCIPKTWKGFDVDYRFGQSVYRIVVKNPSGVESGVASVTVDGGGTDGVIHLVDDGRNHEVIVTLGSPASPRRAE